MCRVILCVDMLRDDFLIFFRDVKYILLINPVISHIALWPEINGKLQGVTSWTVPISNITT